MHKKLIKLFFMLFSSNLVFASSWTQNVINDTEQKYYYGTDNPATINAHSTVYLNWETPSSGVQNIADSDGNIIAYFDDTGISLMDKPYGYAFAVETPNGQIAHCYDVLAGDRVFNNVGLNVHIKNDDIVIENGDAAQINEISANKCITGIIGG